ncbi:hypothetical protein [Paraburkholderia caribensis]|uniref:hypothetical protein n=1 Tax=Paraburkholderia caribensis TaxID=75105 RepID=UPI0007203AFD|nr:hypothetical protein [Paraburkholderia caribensis]ALP68775.1 hypothetical protein AN416_38780 [Paraburkholderia caribensis]AUT58005.1 hypothetical protein C2L66_39840 [Paraburkholderia caribensis]
MAYVIIASKDIQDIRDRLSASQLTEDDVKFLDLLLQRAHRAAELQVAAGRLTVDRLPIGLDLVK